MRSLSKPPATKGFPAHSLKSKGGTLHSWVYENEHSGLARNHFWCFTIAFKAMRYKDVRVQPSMTIEWIPFPIRRWQDLSGQQIEGADGDGGVEASFYVWEHDPARRFSLKVLKRRGTRFLVQMELLVKFQGYDGTDKDPALSVRARTWLKYEGLIVPDDLGRRKPTTAQAGRIAGAFMDMNGYRPPLPKSRTFQPIG